MCVCVCTAASIGLLLFYSYYTNYINENSINIYLHYKYIQTKMEIKKYVARRTCCLSRQARDSLAGVGGLACRAYRRGNSKAAHECLGEG